MSGFVGADVDQLIALAKKVELQSRKFDEIAVSSSIALMVAEWTGGDIDRIRSEWNRQSKPAMQRMSANLATLAVDLRKQAEQQRTTSNAGDRRPLSAADQRIYDAAIKNPKSLGRLMPGEIAAFWASLSDPQRRTLMEKDSVTIGNLPGIPFQDRADANLMTAERRLGESGLSDVERAYLERVTSDPPQIRLAMYDPDRDRLVEIVGNISESTTTYVTYVPGTATTMDSFYRGDVQQVATYLTDRDPNTVVFVYKDGKFPEGRVFSGGPLAFAQAADRDFARDSAAKLSDFQDSVGMATGANSRTVAIGHSWGLADITYSEQNGTHYDEVISLSGAYMPPDWHPSDGTEYSHFVYGLDMLGTAQRAGAVGASLPTTDPAFSQHVYVDEADAKLAHDFINKSQVPVIGSFLAAKDSIAITERSLANHGRIATTAENNQAALVDMRRTIYAH